MAVVVTIMIVIVKRRRTLLELANDQAFLLTAIGLIAVGVTLLAVAQVSPWWIGRDWEHALLEQVGSILIAAMGLALIWEWRGRRALSGEIFDMVQTATSLRDSGLTKYSEDYLKVDWPKLFVGVREIDIFLVYGGTWRRNHHQKLVDALKGNAHIRVVLGSTVKGTPHVRVLAERLDITEDTLLERVNEAIEEYKDIAKAAGGKGCLRIYSWEGDHMFSGYRFDDEVILTLFSHSKERKNVPTFTCVTGPLYNFFNQELSTIMDISKPVFDSCKNGAADVK